VVAEARAGYDGKPYIGEARTVTVAMLEAEIDHPASDERKQVQVETLCRRHDLGQNVHGIEDIRISHQR